MLSNKFIETARRIARADKEVFDTLIEFEQTKKLRTKTRLNFTIDKAVASHFKKYCKDKCYNMSAKVEQAMRDMTKQ